MKKTIQNIAGYMLGGVMFVVLLPTMMWLASGMPDMAVHIGALRASLTGVMMLGGLTLSVWTIVYMKHRGKGNPMDAFGHEVAPRTQHLMTDGPYRLNRNPMLTGTLVYLASFIVWLWTWQAVLVWVIFFAIMFVQVLTEEKRLHRDFGEEYESYCRRTSRFCHLSFWLPIRSIAFLLVFLGCAGVLGQDLGEIGCWWSVIAVVLNVLTIGLLVFLAKRNGQTFWQLINYRKGQTTWQQIVSITLLVLVVGMAGMYLAGFLCYNNFLYAPPGMIAPIPKALAIINIVLLPITTTFAEDGLYLGCGVNQIKNKYAAIIVPAFFYALQHCFIPTLLDGKYIVYRFLSFLPLTIILCWYYYRKRNPLPIMVGHALIDLATAAQIVATSFVPGLYQSMCGL